MTVLFEQKMIGLGSVRVTEEAVIIQRPMNTQTIARSSIIGLDRRVTMFGVFGKGGRTRVTIQTNGGPIAFDMTPNSAAEKLAQVLGYA